MFCKHCGNELIGTERYCDACGEPIEAVRTRAEAAGTPAADGNESRTAKAKEPGAAAGTGIWQGAGAIAQAGAASQQAAYRSFEYTRTNTSRDLAQVTVDCYESLGWELTGQRAAAPGRGGQVTLSFRRSRKVRGKAQLAKIQRTIDDTLVSIANMEADKTRKATRQAIVLGTISALVLGLGMSCTMVWTGLMAVGIVIGVIGLAGCGLAWLRFRKTCEAETARLNPLIENAYDCLATQCEEAQALLRASE